MAEVKVKPDVKGTEPEEGYNDKMVAKAKGEQTEPQAGTEDKLLAGKYKTEEDLQKGVLEILKKTNGDKSLEEVYKELESSLGTSKPEPTKEETATKDLTIDTKDESEETKKVNTDPEVMNKYYDELKENGELSEESYKELEDYGYPKHFIDNYVKGLKAEAETFAKEIYGVTDGEDNYQAVLNWANDNLTADETKVFNESISSGNVAQAKFAVEALYGRYKNANGEKPNLVKGKPSASTGDIFESKQELMSAMRDPRYAKDPAYRQKVAQKLSRSNIF